MNPHSIRFSVVIVCLVFLVGTVSSCTPQPPQITVEGQYADLSGMFLGAGSIFMKIVNAGGRDALIGAALDMPNATVELHDVKDRRMVKTGRIVIASHETVELKPRGMHIMVFNMPKTVREGSVVMVTLKFEKSGDVRVPVQFEKPREIRSEQ